MTRDCDWSRVATSCCSRICLSTSALSAATDADCACRSCLSLSMAPSCRSSHSVGWLGWPCRLEQGHSACLCPPPPLSRPARPGLTGAARTPGASSGTFWARTGDWDTAGAASHAVAPEETRGGQLAGRGGLPAGDTGGGGRSTGDTEGGGRSAGDTEGGRLVVGDAGCSGLATGW
eukprot:scaffold368_cov127-Isochrysis_galbana.AAC.6